MKVKLPLFMMTIIIPKCLLSSVELKIFLSGARIYWLNYPTKAWLPYIQNCANSNLHTVTRPRADLN